MNTVRTTITVDGVTVTVHRSGGSDGAIVVQIDTTFEPDGSDGGPGLRVNINDGDAFTGMAWAAAFDLRTPGNEPWSGGDDNAAIDGDR